VYHTLLETETHGDETNQGDHGTSKYTNLTHDCLCCAIWSSCDNPVVSPLNIDHASYGNNNLESEQRRLGTQIKMKANLISCGRFVDNHLTDHIYVERAVEQLPVTPRDIVLVPSYVPLCTNASLNWTHT
jgi:hypothetical protein